MRFLKGSPIAISMSALSLAFVVNERPAQAILNFYIYDSTPGAGPLAVEAAGKLNLPADVSLTGSCNGGMSPYEAFISNNSICIDPPMTNMNYYSIAGPSSISSSFNSIVQSIPPAITSGQVFFLQSGSLGIDQGYASGADFSGKGVFSGKSLADLGVVAPSLLGTWKLVGTGDVVNVCIGAPGSPCGIAAVPVLLPLFGAAAAFGFSRWLRRRVNQTNSTFKQAQATQV